MHITSLQNPRVKELVHLRQGRQRRRAGEFLIDGRREIERALIRGVAIGEIFYAPERMTPETAAWLVGIRQEKTTIRFLEVSLAVFRKIAYGEREDGVLAVATTTELSLDDLWLRISDHPAPLIGVLEGVEKPGNIGAVLRSADGAGVDALIVAEPQTDLFHPNTIRASLGTIFSVPVCVASGPDTVAFLREHGLAIYAALVEGSVPYTEADFTGASAIVLGSEAWGLSDVFRTSDIHAIALPMLGIADSLNVSTTAAILFYEALRQRKNRG